MHALTISWLSFRHVIVLPFSLYVYAAGLLFLLLNFPYLGIRPLMTFFRRFKFLFLYQHSQILDLISEIIHFIYKHSQPFCFSLQPDLHAFHSFFLPVQLCFPKSSFSGAYCFHCLDEIFPIWIGFLYFKMTLAHDKRKSFLLFSLYYLSSHLVKSLFCPLPLLL